MTMPITNTHINLEDLPLPPPGYSGWPWTEQSQSLPEHMPNGAEWPLISIVTPSYNQGQFIEETIRSVLLQGYPNLEYIIIDGGSRDRSIEIIKKYQKYLSYWVSQPDLGPADAINKGWSRSSGEIVAYLNSDDAYLPRALATVAKAFRQRREALAICGNELKINREGFVIEESKTKKPDHLRLLNLHWISQPATFVKRTTLDLTGRLDLNYKYIFDFELWLRITRLEAIECINELLAVTRWHSDTITFTRRGEVGKELVMAISRELRNNPSDLTADKQQKILFRVNHLAMMLNLEANNMIEAVKYCLASFQLAYSYSLKFYIIKQSLKKLLTLNIDWKKQYLEPELAETIHWSSIAQSRICDRESYL